MSHLILASSSIGRKSLLSLLDIPFSVFPSTINEDRIVGKTPLETIQLRARAKGKNVSDLLLSETYHLKPDTYYVLSADSGAILDGKLYGKPASESDAVTTLKQFSGHTHQFVTAVCLIPIDLKNKKYSKPVEFHDIGQVTFKALTLKQIKHYLTMTDYRKYAGGYALFVLKSCRKPSLKDLLSKEKYSRMHKRLCEEKDHNLNVVEEISGSISNVIGLPLEKVISHLHCQNNLRML